MILLIVNHNKKLLPIEHNVDLVERHKRTLDIRIPNTHSEFVLPFVQDKIVHVQDSKTPHTRYVFIFFLLDCLISASESELS